MYLTPLEQLLHLLGFCQHPNLIPRFIGEPRKYYECINCLKRYYIPDDSIFILRKKWYDYSRQQKH